MKIFDILNPFFNALSDGKLIRLTVAWVLRILAVLMALTGLVGFIAIIVMGFKASDVGIGSRSVGIVIGSVLFAIFALAWGYLAAGILTFRARTVEELGDSHFTVLSILSLLFRLNGEILFVTYSLLGVGGCLFVWITDASPFSQLGAVGGAIPLAGSGGTGFLGGISLAVIFLLIAFMSIVICYALAELTVVLVEIALNTRGLRNAAATAPAPIFTPAPAQPRVEQPFVPVSTPAPAQPRVEQPFVPVSTQRRCKKCGQTLDAGSTFCAECGTQAG